MSSKTGKEMDGETIQTFAGREGWEQFRRSMELRATQRCLKGGFESVDKHKKAIHQRNVRKLHMRGNKVPKYMMQWGMVEGRMRKALGVSESEEDEEEQDEEDVDSQEEMEEEEMEEGVMEDLPDLAIGR